MPSIAPYLLVIALYLLIAFDYWRHARQAPTAARIRLHSVGIALALMLHGWLLYHTLLDGGLNLGFANALSAVAWLTVLIYWLSDVRHTMNSLQAFVLPVAAILVLIQYCLPETHLLPYAGQPLFMTHLVIALLAYSLFTFAALHALLMAVAERSLHQKSTLIKLPDFPPLMAMETLLFRVIAIGFLLLTLTLLSGILFSEALFQQPMKLNHKNIFTLVSWLIFGGLLVGRASYGWRGRVAIRWTLTGFVILLLAYAGSKFVLEIVLGR